jgi:hypothetical protein
MRLALRLHPDSDCFAVTRIEVEVARPRANHLVLSYFVTGRIGDVRMPPVNAAVRTDELWRHTCFEAFVRILPGAAYYEFNFAPSTQWAAYRFSSYRRGMRCANEISAPRIDVQSAPECYALQASLELDEQASSPASGRGSGFASPDAMDLHAGGGGMGGGYPRWRLGLAAVIEETSGRKSYWALAHPPGKADFHHSDGFAYELS